MTAHEIRNAINTEVIRLFVEKRTNPARQLNDFAATATDAELARFRQLLIGLPKQPA